MQVPMRAANTSGFSYRPAVPARSAACKLDTCLFLERMSARGRARLFSDKSNDWRAVRVAPTTRSQLSTASSAQLQAVRVSEQHTTAGSSGGVKNAVNNRGRARHQWAEAPARLAHGTLFNPLGSWLRFRVQSMIQQ
jgi:hypothetical protein